MKPTEKTVQKKTPRSKFQYEAKPTLLRKARIGANLSQDELANQVDYAHTTYGEIERGRRPVRPETAERIALVLKHKVDSLFAPQGKKLIAKLASHSKAP
jgi:DNA-binding XRE family transcriptional regulator